MKYALLFYQDAKFEQYWASATDAQRDEVYVDWTRFSHLLEERGAAILGHELSLSFTATTVRKNGSDTLVTDGPFAETTEHLGGFYIIQARDLDEALELAKDSPCEITEVRAIVEPE